MDGALTASDRQAPGPRAGRALRKREAEALTGLVTNPPTARAAEIAGLRDALDAALRAVTGSTATGWSALVAEVAVRAGWPAGRAADLTRAERPEADPDREATRHALWDLLAELVERRRL